MSLGIHSGLLGREQKKILSRAGILLALLLSGCSGAVTPSLAPIPSATLPAPSLTTVPLVEIPSPTHTVTLTVTPLSEPSATPTVSPTPDPYAAYSVDALAARAYGGGEIQVHETLDANSYFTRTLISYPSDGLEIYGFMNVPVERTPPFPVVIALHGYIDPSIYGTLDYTTRYADALARAGFLVLHPNLRNFPPSHQGDDLFRVGMAIDVLNLIALVKQTGGQPGPLEYADAQAIGLWGHSMGGGISTRVLTVSPDVRAAVLYGAMSGDEQKNYERIYTYFSNGARGLEELGAPEEAVASVSPINYLERVQAAVSIHHGKEDPDVPLAWSLDTCQRLQTLEKEVECFTYPGQGHTFHDEGDELLTQRMIDFYLRTLGEP